MTTITDCRPPKAHLIVMAVAEYYDVTVAEILSHGRYQRMTLARQVAMHLLRKLLGYNLEDIGRILGDRDHTTVVHGLQKIKRLTEAGSELGMQICAIERDIPVLSEPSVNPLAPV